MTKLIKKYTLLVLGLFISILALILLIKSFAVYDDGYGTDISFNMDMVVFLIIGIAVLIYGVNNLRKDSNLENYYLTSLVITVLTACYPLGTFFKAIAKHKPFIDYSNYLYIGIIGLTLFIYYLFAYLDYKKSNK